MDRQLPSRVAAALSLLLLALPAGAADSLSTVAARFQAEASSGRIGALRPMRVALSASEEVNGSAEVQALGDTRCRSIVELIYDRPYEQRGVLITGLKRRSVQDGSCARLAALMTQQAEREAAAIAAQITAATAPAVARPVLAQRPEAPSLLPAPTAILRGQPSYRLTVLKRAVVRDQPSFQGARSAMLPAGQVRLGRLVPGREGWYEILDLASGKGAYIHESVVAQGPPAKRA